MRGKRVDTINYFAFLGITPADAGKTRYTRGGDRNRQDHPRGCGENEAVKYFVKPAAGSPPRMRGKLVSCSNVRSTFRITPADAGKTQQRLQLQTPLKDHPRGCGENQLGQLRFDTSIGSPPRMRGKRLPSCWHSGKV